jgi:hypothetical protein
MLKDITTLIVKEEKNIDRSNEPVTIGIPFPSHLVGDDTDIELVDENDICIPFQFKPMARWHDGSIKWALFDFQISIVGMQQREFRVCFSDSNKKKSSTQNSPHLERIQKRDEIVIFTGLCRFHIPLKVFAPFSKICNDTGVVILDNCSNTVLTEVKGNECLPEVTSVCHETTGDLRSTITLDGKFIGENGNPQLKFKSRLSFYAGLSLCKIDFCILNDRKAEHIGGLWDLGDPGSYFFKDLSINFNLFSRDQSKILWYCSEDEDMNTDSGERICIYQDSSGGDNWNSHNHVNYCGEIQTTFRGYRVYLQDELIQEGLRATPWIGAYSEDRKIGVCIKDFWQNFPKALDANSESIAVRLFPKYFRDSFELQGGEKKTHTVLLAIGDKLSSLQQNAWMNYPLVVHSSPEWYLETNAIPNLMPSSNSSFGVIEKIVNKAISGEDTFFHRRETIDEYGWRNYGDWYADHEAVNHDGKYPLIAHYNNQYDGIFGSLKQYFSTGNSRWLRLADELARHVRDIDIYHTEDDRAEFNNGLFWHTEHYLDVGTATHRCFSKTHAHSRDLSSYGGGPAMSHNYAYGFLYHYYISGDDESRNSVLKLASFIHNMVQSRSTLVYYLVDQVRKIKTLLNNKIHGRSIIEYTKVFSLDGPGRGAGNSIHTLLAAYELTQKRMFIDDVEDIIVLCIHPFDNIDGMDMFDIENRWMYTIFLQSLLAYLKVKEIIEEFDDKWSYAKDSFLSYVRWMCRNEYFYLDKPEELEYPNETWAAQELRKSFIFMHALSYCKEDEKSRLIEKAIYFYNKACQHLSLSDTAHLTRPITVVLQNMIEDPKASRNSSKRTANGNLDSANKIAKYSAGVENNAITKNRTIRQIRQIFKRISIRREIEFLSQRIQ